MRCRECHALLDLQDLPPGTAESGGLRVEIFGLRGVGCGNPDHPPEPPYPDFPADLMAAVAAGGALPVGARRGWLRSRPRCARCGEDLSGASPDPGAVRARLRMEGVAPFTLSVEGPVLECPGCHLRQLAPEADGRALERAIRAALRATGIPHLGTEPQ